MLLKLELTQWEATLIGNRMTPKLRQLIRFLARWKQCPQMHLGTQEIGNNEAKTDSVNEHEVFELQKLKLQHHCLALHFPKIGHRLSRLVS